VKKTTKELHATILALLKIKINKFMQFNFNFEATERSLLRGDCRHSQVALRLSYRTVEPKHKAQERDDQQRLKSALLRRGNNVGRHEEEITN
jgi:hypothetical protein